MKNKFLILTSSLLVVLSGHVFAAPESNGSGNSKADNIDVVENWLSKMHQAAHTVNYQGIFVYGQKNNLSSMRIIHSADANGERERLLSLDGTGREVIRSKNSVTCILPDSKSVTVEKNRPKSKFPPAFPVKVSELSRNYTFYLAGKETVAGHTAQKIIIEPKDQFRYGHALWIDDKTGLLLKTHLMDETKQTIEKFMFTQIDYMENIPEKLLKPSISGQNFTWYESGQDKKEEKNVSSSWRVKHLPSGFNADMNRRHVMPRSGIAIEQLMYSDGLSSVSVFIEKHSNNNDQITGDSQMGAINACGRGLENNIHVTVVGEVTNATVKMMCDSVYQIK